MNQKNHVIIVVCIFLMFCVSVYTLREHHIEKNKKPITPPFIIIGKEIYYGRTFSVSDYKAIDVYGNVIEFEDDPGLYQIGDTIKNK